MKCVVLMALVGVLVLAGRAVAQPVGTLENLRDKSAITDQDRQQIRTWATAMANNLATNNDADRRGMIAARDAIIAEGRKEGRSAAYYQAFGEEAINALKAAEKKAVGQDARVNLFTAVAELRRVEGIELLRTALEKDPYPAARYWAAKGLSMVADAVIEKNTPRLEADIADSIAKIIDAETSPVMLLWLFDALGRFDHEKAHDVLADAAAKAVTRVSVADPIASKVAVGIIRSLEKAYMREVRPEAKTRILSAFAVLCASILPPKKNEPEPLLISLNAALEKITGEKVGFVATDDGVMQKLALLEWVEKFVREKKIPKRPSLPPALEDSLKDIVGGPGGALTP
jgi:hypothetical protein